PLQRAQGGMAGADVQAPGHDLVGDAVGFAQLGQVGVARGQADHPGGVAVAGRARRVAEAQDHAGRVGERLQVQAQFGGHADQGAFQALRRGAVGVQVLGQFDDEGDAGGVCGGFHGRKCILGPQGARTGNAARMTVASNSRPRVAVEGDCLRLSGSWTLDQAAGIAEALRSAPQESCPIDATGVDRLDSLGVVQLLRHARRTGSYSDAIEFREDHLPLVTAIEDVTDDRPRGKREYGFAAAIGRLGFAVADNWKEIVALVSFLGESLVKLLRMAKEPRRFRATATVAHMEQVGLDAVPLVALLSFLVGAVIAFLGSNILADFGATIYVVELVNIAFLREFGVLLTSIVLAGRTASAFTAQIGAMVSREEVDAMR